MLSRSAFIRQAATVSLLLSLRFSPAMATSANTNSLCSLGALPAPGETLYWAPSDNFDIAVNVSSITNCSPGSTGIVTLRGQGVCGLFPLDGQPHLVDCPVATVTVNRGTVPAGVLYFDFDLGVVSLYDEISVVHTQSTIGLLTPTVTVTTTPTSTASTTISITDTETVTSPPQVTVTSSARSYTRTVTPPRATVTTTSTINAIRTKYITTVVKASTTSTAPCTTRTYGHVPTQTSKHHQRYQPKENLNVEKRDEMEERAVNTGDVEGDGPLTVTSTPDPTTTSVTASSVTFTNSYFSTVSTKTITISPSPATTTIYSGVARRIITLPQSTRTKTKTTQIIASTTKTVTVTFTAKTVTTPACTRRNH